MTERVDPLTELNAVPWSRLVHFYGRATAVPGHIRDLATDDHAEAEKQLRGCLEHQDGILQATPFAVRFILRMLNAGQVRDPSAVQELLAAIRRAAQFQKEGFPSRDPLDWNSLLLPERLWPEFKSESDDERLWEMWNPPPEEWQSWVLITDRYLAESLG